ncbi:uncharacterized protein LOC134214007 isoform X2 [Armigeres subalbatus]|uniref:uncharacterized protein LOC134214007 isoform X2 n=1 Tax=Armigeres subalbatus TaxID=124917 RepID=UPI002ECFB517
MPFAIVQTHSAGGREELSAVPEKWINTSIHGNILWWPSVKSSSEQAKLQRDENCAPGKSWLRYKCRIKRKNISTYAQAASLIDEMSGCSSSDVSLILKKKKKSNKTAPVNFHDLLNLPADEPSLQITPHRKVSVNISRKTPSKLIATAAPPKRTLLPATVEAQSASGILPSYEFDAANNNYPELLSLTNNPQSSSAKSIEQCVDLLNRLIDMQQKSNTMLNTRISSLEKRLAHQSTQLEFIMDALKSRNDQGEATESGRSFCFQRIDDSRKLEDLEKNLENESYRSNLVKWLRVNVCGDCADERMLCVLDLMMTKKFQAQCTWTGSSRKGPKIPIMVNRKMLKVFVEIGTSDTEIVTQQKLTNFFMKKLKNAGKRLKSSGVRRSSRHVVKKRVINRNEESQHITTGGKGLIVIEKADDRIDQGVEIKGEQENYEPYEYLDEISGEIGTAGNEPVNDMDAESSNETCSTDEYYEGSLDMEENDPLDDNVCELAE